VEFFVAAPDYPVTQASLEVPQRRFLETPARSLPVVTPFTVRLDRRVYAPTFTLAAVSIVIAAGCSVAAGMAVRGAGVASWFMGWLVEAERSSPLAIGLPVLVGGRGRAGFALYHRWWLGVVADGWLASLCVGLCAEGDRTCLTAYRPAAARSLIAESAPFSCTWRAKPHENGALSLILGKRRGRPGPRPPPKR